MPRCIVCDYCSEVGSGPQKKVEWDDKEKGYVCETCTEIAREAENEFTSEEEDLGGFELLEDAGVEEPEEENPG